MLLRSGCLFSIFGKLTTGDSQKPMRCRYFFFRQALDFTFDANSAPLPAYIGKDELSRIYIHKPMRAQRDGMKKRRAPVFLCGQTVNLKMIESRSSFPENLISSRNVAEKKSASALNVAEKKSDSALNVA